MRRLLARWWPWALAVTSVLAAALVVGPGGSDGTALDPRSTAPGGARAVVDVLEELGRPVTIAPRPSPGTTTFVVLDDQLDRAAREDVRRWTAGGGRLVVADPGSPLLRDVAVAARLPTDLVGATAFPPACDDPALRDVELVRSATWVAFDAAPADRTCFPVEGGAWLLRRPVGAGELVALGGADAFTNARLGEADNALLLVRLLDGVGEVVIADELPPGGGDATLTELVPDRVHIALALLVVAFLLAAWAHGRRLGDPVEERLPVRVPASELVLATADLMRRSELRDAAADALRGELRQEATTRLGLPLDAPDHVVARRIAAWTGTDADGVAAALSPGGVPDDDTLVRTARTVTRLRRRLTVGQLASPGRGIASSAPGDDDGEDA